MVLLDVNVLVYAHRVDAPGHDAYHSWLEDLVNAEAGFGLCDLALSGFLRVVTHPHVFSVPTPLEKALAFSNELRSRDNCILVAPGERHWGIFEGLCRAAKVRGNLVPDAYFAALAIEHGAEWITADRDYARFPELRWRHPFQ
jgi:toxin-antitoxin system PIN domain toxin